MKHKKKNTHTIAKASGKNVWQAKIKNKLNSNNNKRNRLFFFFKSQYRKKEIKTHASEIILLNKGIF